MNSNERIQGQIDQLKALRSQVKSKMRYNFIDDLKSDMTYAHYDELWSAQSFFLSSNFKFSTLLNWERSSYL